MKKLLLIICAIIISTVNLSAQEYTIYYENFDANNGGWTSSTAGGRNGSWVYDTTNTLISEGGYWRINAFNNYGANYLTYLTNPSAISTVGFNNVTFYLDIRYDSSNDPANDGAQIQYTLDPTGTVGWTRLGNYNSTGSTFWYTNVDVDGIANAEHGWTGKNSENSTSNSKFVEASLPDSVLDNQPSLRFRVVFGSTASTHDVGVAIDNIIIKGDYILSPSDPTYGPGNVNTNLKLWLKSDSGTSTSTDNTALTTWSDQAFDNDAEAYNTASPIYKNNPSDNMNFNPVIDFQRSSSDVMKGKGGFWTHDYWVVVQTNNTFDKTTTNTQVPISGKVNTRGFSVDGTGLGFGRISSRFNSDNLVSHMIGSYNNAGTTPGSDSYGRSYAPSAINSLGTDVMILNVKSNTSVSPNISEIYYNGKRVDNHAGTTGTTGTGTDLLHTEFDNSRFVLGAGQFSINGHALSSFLDGQLSEVISYSNAINSTDQQKVQSYLAIKYGVTLKQSGSSLEAFDNQNDVDYVDSSGNVIWDTSANSGFNYDVAGIGRDDNSELNQKQSSSSNDATDGTGLIEGIVTMGLTDIYDTNSDNISSNPTTLNDREFLVWGDNNASLDAAPFTIAVDMSDGISGLSTPVSFIGMQRTWKVVETGGDIPSVKVSIPQNAVRNISPPGSYLMFISDTSIFDPTADYRVMTEDGFGNLEAEYDFDGEKYVTFGYAPQVEVERSVYFDGTDDYIDVGNFKELNSSEFTVSAWIKRSPGSGNKTIFSKRDATYTQGYDAKITWGGNFEMSWINGTKQTITGTTYIPENEWHHVSLIFDNGTANLYIDGVLDQTASLSSPVSTSESFIIAGAGKTSTTDLFIGNIDEVRVWDVALTIDQLRYIMNQEIEENATFVDGMELPTSLSKNEVATIPWSDLAGYYPMSIYTYTNTNDHSDNDNQGALRNLDTVDFQTAPLPYESDASSNWDLSSTWLNGSVNKIPGSTSIVDANTSVDWNIVKINHNITVDNYSTVPATNNLNRTLLGLIIDSNELTVGATPYNSFVGFGLTVSHYLELNGSIDLEGESQLIQTDRSVLVVGASGSLEKDQQGTADFYTYNYWSSPVGDVYTTSNNATNETRYTIPDVVMDGTTATSPVAINFLTSGYDGTNTNPIGIADYWIWKFADQLDDDYSAWQHVRSTGTMYAGEGYTMKGPGTGPITSDQNYVFNGKPNNGDVTLSISANNDYLVGNPYASAIDAHEFITDNPDTNGTLYFWEHWGGNSHALSQYRGGYAQYNYSGGTPNAYLATLDPDVDNSLPATPSKLPGRYIPVSQGFFVYSPGGGTINFKNDQRVFETEGANSTFIRASSESSENIGSYNEDGRMKFRIGFDSFNGIHRQLLLTIDSNATPDVDWGYDGKLNEEQMDDMFWMIEGGKYVIQGSNEALPETIVPLGIHVRDDGLNSITIDHLENVPDEMDIYVHDNVLNVYHDLRQSDYEVDLTAGDYLNRFAITFENSGALSIDDNVLNNAFEVFYNNDSESIVLRNPSLMEIDSIELFNILGQSIYYTNEIDKQNYTEIKVSSLITGAYIINIDSQNGKISKKVLVE